MGAAIHAASLVEQGSERRVPARRDAALAADRRRRRARRAGDRAQHAGADRADAHLHDVRSDDQESVKIRVYQGESREAERERAARPVRVLGFQRGAARRGRDRRHLRDQHRRHRERDRARPARPGSRRRRAITLSSGLSEREIKNIIDRGVASRVQTAARAGGCGAGRASCARRPRRRRRRAPSPRRCRAPAMIDDDEDALIPIESDSAMRRDDLDADLLEDAAGPISRREPLEVDPDATTQPELAASAPSDPSVRPPPIRANEVELSEDDLAALDTSDLDAAIERARTVALRHLGRRPLRWRPRAAETDPRP